MGVNAQQVRGDARSDALAELNRKEVPFVPDEITEFAEHNLIHVYNISPYRHEVLHPMIGRFVIPACPPGKAYSEPAIIKGMIPYGVPVDMKAVEIRHDSGRTVAVDLLGIGPFRKPESSLLRRGVFIAANDTFDEKDVANVKVATDKQGKPIMLSLPRWVKNGKLGIKPTQKEIDRANECLAENDFAMIAEADEYWNAGPQQTNNIVKMHREALRRRGQQRPWDQPLQTLADCPGCQEKIKPGIVVHTCGAVLDWDKAIALGIKKASERPQSKPAA